MPKLSSSFEPAEERRDKSRLGFSSSSSCLMRSRSTVDQRLVLGGSHRKTALAQVREAGQILRHQIRLAFWSAAKTRAEVRSKLEQRAQGRVASAVASYHRSGAAGHPRDNGWVLDKRQLAQLLHNLQINLCDPIHDAVVIMDALDVDGTGTISVDEWCGTFEHAICKLESSETEHFRDLSGDSGAHGSRAQVEILLLDIDRIMQRTFKAVVQRGYQVFARYSLYRYFPLLISLGNPAAPGARRGLP